MIGEGRIHGEDDIIAERVYQASLTCNVKESELLVLTQADFYRVFRQSEDSWLNAVKHARNKEKEYLIRCRSYLDTGKLVIDKSNNEVLKKKMGRV